MSGLLVAMQHSKPQRRMDVLVTHALFNTLYQVAFKKLLLATDEHGYTLILMFQFTRYEWRPFSVAVTTAKHEMYE